MNSFYNKHVPKLTFPNLHEFHIQLTWIGFRFYPRTWFHLQKTWIGSFRFSEHTCILWKAVTWLIDSTFSCNTLLIFLRRNQLLWNKFLKKLGKRYWHKTYNEYNMKFSFLSHRLWRSFYSCIIYSAHITEISLKHTMLVSTARSRLLD